MLQQALKVLVLKTQVICNTPVKKFLQNEVAITYATLIIVCLAGSVDMLPLVSLSFVGSYQTQSVTMVDLNWPAKASLLFH